MINFSRSKDFSVQDGARPPGQGPEKDPGNAQLPYKTLYFFTFLIIYGCPLAAGGERPANGKKLWLGRDVILLIN